jgi:dienelactone hydrolase
MIPLLKKEGRDKGEIPVYVRMPKQKDEKLEQKVPVVILMTGLDGYRPDNTLRSQEFINRGWGTIIVEIPGTADCPADPADPKSGDRLWSSMFEWMEKDGRFEMGKCMVWGLSAGGYYAVRVAHTHRERLKGVVAQGAGVHEFFDREWVERADGHEYPFL